MENCDGQKANNSELLEALGRIIKNMSQMTDEEIKSSMDDGTTDPEKFIS